MSRDPPFVQIVVHVNWKTEYDDINHTPTKFWHRPLELKVTRADYENDPYFLFHILNHLLPEEQWAKVTWAPATWTALGFKPLAFDLDYENVLRDMRHVSRRMLGITEDDRMPTDTYDFWLYSKDGYRSSDCTVS